MPHDAFPNTMRPTYGGDAGGTAPPSVLPDISPARGEISRRVGFCQSPRSPRLSQPDAGPFTVFVHKDDADRFQSRTHCLDRLIGHTAALSFKVNNRR